MSHAFNTFDTNGTPNAGGGCVLILCNQLNDAPHFHLEYEKRMRTVWNIDIGCELFEETTHLNKSSQDIDNIFKRLATMKDARKFKYLVIIVVTRGGLTKLQDGAGAYSPHMVGFDGTELSEEKIFSYFRNDRSSWHGIPKLFILGYSRLTELLPITDGTGRTFTDDLMIAAKSTNDSQPTTIPNTLDPTISDIVLFYGEPSKNFIMKIDEVFSEEWHQEILTNLLTSVNHRMRSVRGGISVYESCMAKIWKLVKLNNDSSRNVLTDSIQDILESHPTATKQRNALLSYIAHLKADELATLHAGAIVQEEIIKSNIITPVKGCVLIISNALSDESEAHIEDNKMMKELWKDTLQCDLFGETPYSNLSAAGMTTVLTKLAETNSDQYKYVVVYISTHGGLRECRDDSNNLHPCFSGIDGELVEERKLLSLFNRPESPWQGKSKIFILDYCRGGKIDRGLPSKSITEEILLLNENILPPFITTPVHDSFIVHSTHVHFVALANRLTRAISEVFKNNWETESVSRMLTMVNENMKKNSEFRAKTMSVFKSTVTTEFLLYETTQRETGASVDDVSDIPANAN